jgi:L-threonylcarbamoyladenylate synthase
MDALDNLEEILKEGGTILYPTDTIWGIGCDATNEEACQKILKIKQRPEDKSFIVLVDSIQMLEKYTISFPEVCYDLIDYAVKPLTIIYPNSRGLAPSVLAKDGSVGIRVTNDPFCIKLIRTLKKPIVSTSANVSGEKSPVNFTTVPEIIKQSVDIVVPDNGKVQSQPSQILKIGADSSIKIIRD